MRGANHLKNEAYRYDLLCIEGIARALRVFLGLDKPPQYKLAYPPGGEADLITTTITKEVSNSLELRPHFHSKLHVDCRPKVSVLSSLVQFSGTSSSLSGHTNLSSTCRTSSTKTFVGVGSLSLLVRTTLIPSRRLSCTMRDHRRTSNLSHYPKTSCILQMS